MSETSVELAAILDRCYHDLPVVFYLDASKYLRSHQDRVARYFKTYLQENRKIGKMANALFILARNCESEILGCLDQIEKIKGRFDTLILINNKSTDGTLQRVIKWRSENNLEIVIFNNRYNFGLGGSHKIAFDYAKKNKLSEIAILHGDNQTDVAPFLEYGRSESTRLGARFLNTHLLDESYSRKRIFLNKILNFIFSIRFRRRIFDMGSGLNIYGLDAINSFLPDNYPDDMTFNYYHLAHMCSEELDLSWMPINWRASSSDSNVRMLPHLINSINLLLARKPKANQSQLLGEYDVI